MTLTDHDLSGLLAALKAGELTDPIRTSLEWILQQLIEAEATSFIGAGPHERTDARTNQRKGQSSPTALDPDLPRAQVSTAFGGEHPEDWSDLVTDDPPGRDA